MYIFAGQYHRLFISWSCFLKHKLYSNSSKALNKNHWISTSRYNSTFLPCILYREASYGVYLPSAMNQSQGMIFFFIETKISPTTTHLPKNSWDGKVPLRERNSYRREICITPPLNRDRIVPSLNDYWLISFGKH